MDDKLILYILDELDPERRSEVDRALEADPELKNRLAALQRAVEQARQAYDSLPAPDSQPDPELADVRVEPRTIRSGGYRPSWRRLLAGGFVTAAIALAVGFFWVDNPARKIATAPQCDRATAPMARHVPEASQSEPQPERDIMQAEILEITADEAEPSGQDGQQAIVGLRGIIERTPTRREQLKQKIDQEVLFKRMDERYPIGLLNQKPAMEPNAPDGFTGTNENQFTAVKTENFSTFGLDVDTASYTLMRSYIEQSKQLPPPSSVRVEEYVNYFDYALPEPESGTGSESGSESQSGANDDCPFRASAQVGPHPWTPGLLLAKIGIQGRCVDPADVEPLNLVFLLDVSGSMSDWNRLPLVKDAMNKLVDRLRPQDRVAIVTYASQTNVALESTAGSDKGAIEKAILQLEAGGSTYGSGGLKLAYEQARTHFDSQAINRVILCSDGDFNVGVANSAELEQMIAEEAKSGVFLTVLGFGMGNLKDNRLEALADKGNGNYGYIDSRAEAQRALVDDLTGTLVTIAKDVKVQIDFNPAAVAEYRLIGYENRKLATRDFNDDKKDAGDIGAGHSVVALYELVPTGTENPYKVPEADRSRYATAEPEVETVVENQESAEPTEPTAKHADELFLVKIRYKAPAAEKSVYKDFPVTHPTDDQLRQTAQSPEFRFAAAVALYAQILRKSQFVDNCSLETVKELLEGTVGTDEKRIQFQRLVEAAISAREER